MIKNWTEEQKARLAMFWVEDGLSMLQIAWKMGRSRNSIASKIARMGLCGMGHRLPGQTLPDDYKKPSSSPLAP